MRYQKYQQARTNSRDFNVFRRSSLSREGLTRTWWFATVANLSFVTLLAWFGRHALACPLSTTHCNTSFPL